MRRAVLWIGSASAVLLATACAGMSGLSGGSSHPMSFFVTSVNPGKGGDLGGIAGADQYCQRLASSVGAGGKTWRAYLSAPASGGSPAVNARDRIGRGPWANVKGVVIARDLSELHGNNNLNTPTALDEKGNEIVRSQHDMMTGSNMDGTAITQGADMSCRAWTSSTDGSAMVGHVNRTGTNPDPVRNSSWNSSHGTPGCDTASLARVGGGGLFYCFAAN